MELDEAINNRVSVSKFKDKEVEKERLNKLINAAIKAPNASNLENWKFIVHKDETREEIRKLVIEGQTKYYELMGTPEEKIEKLQKKFDEGMYDAPAYIGVYIDRNKKQFDKHDDLEFYWDIESASLAIENLILKAVDLGLGSCYLGVTNFPDIVNKVRDLADLDPNHFLVGMIMVGYPDRDLSQSNRTKDVEEVTKFI